MLVGQDGMIDFVICNLGILLVGQNSMVDLSLLKVLHEYFMGVSRWYNCFFQ